MPAQTATKATTAVGSDGWNPVAHMKQLSETTRSIIPVANEAERDGLAAAFPGGLLPVPTYVNRADNGNVIEKWDGAKWLSRPHIEFTFSQGGIPDATLWGPGTLTLDTGAATTDQSLATSPGGDLLKLNKGTYAISFSGGMNRVSTGTSWFQIRPGDDSDVHAHGTGAEVWCSVSIPNLRITADNTQIRLRLKWTSGGAVTASGRVRITRVS